jgi:hypothetical protein
MVTLLGNNTVWVWDLTNRRPLAVYPGSAVFSSVALQGAENVICAGTETGEVLFLELHGVSSGPAILTAANTQQARCPVCGQELAPPAVVVAAIQERSQPSSPDGYAAPRKSGVRSQQGGLLCFDLPTSAFADLSAEVSAKEDQRLLSVCPHCQHPLRFNPFFAAADDYAEVLRRGLEFSRREKGADHAETLAHLAALAAHYEHLGQPEAARPFAEEHARLKERIKDEL